MDRQLDPLGSQLLHEELTDKGIDIFYDDEIERFLGKKKIEGVRLKSGREIACQAIVIAIGTTPNIELANNSGIECNLGVNLNEYLQTNDPSVYAIGEIAEFKGFLYGITAAAEQQADIVAKHLSGDIAHYYDGSLLMNILKMQGTDLCSLGLAEVPNNDPSYEEIVVSGGRIIFIKKKQLNRKKILPLVSISVPMAFLGATLKLSQDTFFIILGCSKH